MKNLNCISFLRGISAFYVMIAHILIWGGYHKFILEPKVAVDIFIFISGFLIARGLGNNYSSVNNLKEFYLKRFFRIAPVFYLVILICIMLFPYLQDGLEHIQSLDRLRWPEGSKYDASFIIYDVKNVLLHISFLYGFSPEYSSSTYIGDWSIALEMQFYAIFPFLYVYFNRGDSQLFRTVLTVLFLAGLSILLNRWYWKFDEPSFVLFKIHIFFIGAMSASILGSDNQKNNRSAFIVIFILFVFQLLLAIISYNAKFSLVALLLVVLFVFTCLRNKKYDQIFDNKFVHFFSQISYPLFLFHGVFIALGGYLYKFFSFNLSLLVFLFCFVVPLSIVMAWIISNTVEKWGIEYPRKKNERYNISRRIRN